MGKQYSKEFRDDVVRLARKGDATIEQLALDFDLRPRSLEDLEYRGPVDLDELAAFEDEAFPYLFVFNVLGWPAVSIPFGARRPRGDSARRSNRCTPRLGECTSCNRGRTV